MEQPIIDRMTSTGARQLVYKFDNGYGASVIRGPYTYGGDRGLFELAVLEFDADDWLLTYSTPITDDVIGYQSADEIDQLLKQIQALPAKASA